MARLAETVRRIMETREVTKVNEYNLENFELIQGKSSNIFGLQLKDRDSKDVSIWWATDETIAKIHGRIHFELNRNNKQLDEMAGVYPPGSYQ